MRRLRSLALSANVGRIMHVFCKVVTSYRHMAVTPVKGLTNDKFSENRLKNSTLFASNSETMMCMELKLILL